MESKNQIVKSAPGTLSILSDSQKSVIKVVAKVNNLVGFQKDAAELIDWGKEIDRLFPEMELEKISFLMDQFMLGNLDWDDKKGIQNLTVNLSRVVREKGVLVLKSNVKPW